MKLKRIDKIPLNLIPECRIEEGIGLLIELRLSWMKDKSNENWKRIERKILFKFGYYRLGKGQKNITVTKKPFGYKGLSYKIVCGDKGDGSIFIPNGSWSISITSSYFTRRLYEYPLKK